MLNKLLNKIFKDTANGWLIGLVPATLGTIFLLNETMFIDARFWLRGETEAHPALVVVALDENYTANHKSHDPVGRDYLAALVDSLSYHGARVIVLDYAIRISDREDTNYVKLENAIAKAGNVVLPSLLNPDARNKALLDVPPPEIKELVKSGYAELLGEHPLFMRNLVELDNSQVEPSLALAAIALYKERSQHQGDPIQGSLKPSKIQDRNDWQTVLSSANYPADGNKALPINFFGRVHTDNIPTFPSEWIFQSETSAFQDKYIKDKLVLVGSTYADKSGSDTFQSPFGLMQGVEIHANIINNLLSEEYLQQPGLVLSLLFILISAGSGVFFHERFSIATATLCLLLFPIIYITVAYLSFSFLQVLIPVARPIQAGFIGFFATFILRHYWPSAHQAKS